MKAKYRGYDIDVRREKCMAGYPLLYYSVFRISDGYSCVDNYEDSAETVRDMVGHMKARIDAELAEDDPWGEKADAEWNAAQTYKQQDETPGVEEMVGLGWLGALVEAAVGIDPDWELTEWCGEHYSPYYGLMWLLADELPTDGDCVELGVEKGRAAFALALSGREVHGFDHTRRDEIHPLSVRFPNFHFYERPSLPPPEDWDRPIAILHVDTEHSYAMAREEFNAWKKHLVPGAIVLFDDTHAMESEVGHFVSTLCYPTILDDRLHSCGYAVMLYE